MCMTEMLKKEEDVPKYDHVAKLSQTNFNHLWDFLSSQGVRDANETQIPHLCCSISIDVDEPAIFKAHVFITQEREYLRFQD